MKSIDEAFPRKEYEYRENLSYESLIESAGLKILCGESDNDYQGSTYLLVWDGKRYGLLSYSWGSCSVCDSLEACRDDDEELSKLRDDLVSSVKWYENSDINEALESLLVPESEDFTDWDGDLKRRFIAAAKEKFKTM
jgi:hypothetical protein